MIALLRKCPTRTLIVTINGKFPKGVFYKLRDELHRLQWKYQFCDAFLAYCQRFAPITAYLCTNLWGLRV